MIVNMTGSPYLDWQEEAFVAAMKLGTKIIDKPYPQLHHPDRSALPLPQILANAKASVPKYTRSVILGTNGGIMATLISAFQCLGIECYVGPIYVGRQPGYNFSKVG